MDSAVTIIYKFSSTQINNSKVIWISVRILVKAEAETEYIIEALFEAAMVLVMGICVYNIVKFL